MSSFRITSLPENFIRGVEIKTPITKTNKESNTFLCSLNNQYPKKSKFMITNNGTKRLKTAKAGIVFGDIKGSIYDSNNAVATNELIKNNNLFTKEFLFMY
ncbi:hypothetical protein [Tenacibaculum crassostreae]|uniref:hypothetical protein n=1 Tax=Tenacibaculum crassostreae TaxID=502683 RepID=UPI0038B53780